MKSTGTEPRAARSVEGGQEVVRGGGDGGDDEHVRGHAALLRSFPSDGAYACANGRSTTSRAHAVRRRRASESPGAASRRTSASAIGPCSGDSTTEPSRADLALAEPQRLAVGGRAAQPQPAQVAVRLAAEVQPRDGLLADVAALLERHRARVQAGLLRDHGVVEVDAVARPAGLDAAHLGVGLARRAPRPRRRARRRRARCRRRRTARRRRGRWRSAAPARRRSPPRGARARSSGSSSAPAMRRASGPISDSRPRSSVRLCSSTSRPSLKRRIIVNSSCSATRSQSSSSSSPASRMRRSPSILPLCVRNAA